MGLETPKKSSSDRSEIDEKKFFGENVTRMVDSARIGRWSCGLKLIEHYNEALGTTPLPVPLLC